MQPDLLIVSAIMFVDLYKQLKHFWETEELPGNLEGFSYYHDI